jgi:hypothetical protein
MTTKDQFWVDWETLLKNMINLKNVTEKLLIKHKCLNHEKFIKERAKKMTKTEKISIKKAVILVAVLVSLLILWIGYFCYGSFSFNKENAISIYGTIVQGMSALLSVSIAVIIFRIQSLENRLLSLEELTISYIFQITQLVYPKWLPCLEEHISGRIITNQYYKKRVRKKKLGTLEHSIATLKKDRDDQQNRLMEALNEHTRIKQIIHKAKKGAYPSFILLISPILLSFYLLMISDALANWISFFMASFVILLSILGIFSLTITVVDSLATE